MFVLNLDVLAVNAVKYQATYLEILLFFPLLPLPPLPCWAFCWFIIIMTQCLFPPIACHIEDCWWYLRHWSSTSVCCISHLTLFSLAQVKMILTVYGTKDQSCIWVNCCEKNTPEVVSVVSHSRTSPHFVFFWFFLFSSLSFSSPGSSDGGGSDVPPLLSGGSSQRPHSGADGRRLRLHFWPQHLSSAGSLSTSSGSTRPQAGRRWRVTIFILCNDIFFFFEMKIYCLSIHFCKYITHSKAVWVLCWESLWYWSFTICLCCACRCSPRP